MKIRFTKKENGKGQLTCVRDDGSVERAPFVPGMGVGEIPHDLVHYAVEVVLPLTRGLYGLIQEGKSTSDLLTKDWKERWKDDAPELLLSEDVAAYLQAELAHGRDAVEEFYKKPEVADEKLDAARKLILKYREEWKKLPLGETLEVEF